MSRKKLLYIGGLVVIIAVVLLVFRVRHEASEGLEEVVEEEIAIDIIEPEQLYGLPVDSFNIINSRVKKGEFLSDILLEGGVEYRLIDKLARETKETFDVRRIRIGNNYSIFQKKRDSITTTQYFVYEISTSKYVLYTFQKDSVLARLEEKEITKKIRYGAGEIKSSLWNAMAEADMNPVLSNYLSDIYAWTIDFYGLQKGDKFRVIYEELYVDTIPVGIGDVIASEYIFMGDSYDAYLFAQDSTASYFNGDGKSLKKAFLKAPLKFSRISSRFSYSRMHPVIRRRRPHLGVDYAAAGGTPIRSIGDGTIIKKSYQKRGAGNYLKIKHNSVYTTSYMHMRGFAEGIHQGARVKQGQIIGYVGTTGLSTGNHLDFRVYMNGKAVDPLTIKSPPVEPIKDEYMSKFNQYRDSLSVVLKSIK